VKYSLITQQKNTFPIRLLCQVLGVSRPCYYYYRQQMAKKREDGVHRDMLAWIKANDEWSDQSYGSRRMKNALNGLGYPVSRNKVRKLMREAGVAVRCRKQYKVTTNSNHTHPVFDNLLQRQFSVSQPDHVYAADITYVWTQEGWLYLAVVIDLCSRKVVGWSMSARMKARLVCDAFKMALWQRRPQAGLIHHSDRGAQYASHAFRRLLGTNGVRGSMSRQGDCWDNAVVESFFGSLKQERVQWRHYQTRQEAQQDILQYIAMFYNRYRVHSTLGYISPHDFEKQFGAREKVA
jgi:transposase InsO family protein